jgi:hypothetical protein
MNEGQTVATDCGGPNFSSEPAHAEIGVCRITGLMRPDEVAADGLLTRGEKREILAFWASDRRAVPNAPTLRQLDNGAVVRIGDVLQALKSLNDTNTLKAPFAKRLQLLAGSAVRRTGRSGPYHRRSNFGDDDDPFSCLATPSGPRAGPLTGGEAADLSTSPAV